MMSGMQNKTSRLLAVASMVLAFASADAAFAKPGNGGGNGGGGGGGAPSQPFQLGSTLCKMSDIGMSSGSCAGFYEGNLDSGSPAALTASAAALNSLLGVSTFTAANLTWLDDVSPATSPVDFGQTLYGQTVVSFHVGAAKGADGGVGYDGTAFYLFDAGDNGLDVLSFLRPGLSNARLFSTGAPPPPKDPPIIGDPGGQLTAVPEPATWAMLLLGLFGMGGALRRRRSLETATA
jgi:hypothetical protein